MSRSLTDHDPVVAAGVPLAFLGDRVKRIANALGCSLITAKRIVSGGRVSQRYEPQLLDELEQRIRLNIRAGEEVLQLIEKRKQERRYGVDRRHGEDGGRVDLRDVRGDRDGDRQRDPVDRPARHLARALA